MRTSIVRVFRSFGLSMLIWSAGSVRTMAGGCAVSDASQLNSEDGCKLAFVYNQEKDGRLVVIDEKTRRRYEAPLEGGMAPFWENGKVYVLAHSGTVQGFSIQSDKLVADKSETIPVAVVRHCAYASSQHRLYLIQTTWNDHRKILYNLVAIDFPERKTLWTKRIDDPGVIEVMEQYICVMGLNLAEIYNCDTGDKLAAVTVPKAIAAVDANK